MKHIILFICFTITIHSFGQTKNYKITYLKSSNGKLIENQEPILVFTNENETLITSQKNIDEKSEFPFEKISFNRNKESSFKTTAQLSSSKILTTIDSISLAKQSFEFLPETKILLGYECKKAKTIINSNTIEIWYTNKINCKASPTTLGLNLGLVLEINRNGNFLISATKIEKIKTFLKKSIVNTQEKLVDVLTYKDLIWKSRFTTIPIFKDEAINFSDASKSNDSVFRYGNGTIALRKIKFPEIKNSTQLFVDLQEQSNGDAYDRTGSIFIIPMDKKQSFLDGLKNGAKELPIYSNGNGKEYQGVVSTSTYSPLIELMRFFTPFGIKHFNTVELKDKKWFDSASYRQDISDLKSVLSNNEVWIGTFIGNYDKGGHKISMNITIHNENEIKSIDKKVVSLFNTTNVMEMAGQEYGTMFNNDKGLEVTFTLDKEMKNVKLRYITTGHGGWENGDEFLQKPNTIFLDSKEVYSFIPWRTDCGSYRLYNPASGNFQNGLSSSDYSRSNWCPGTTTNPIYIDLGNLSAGTHTIQVKIPQGENEGTSFSAWNISGVLIGE